MVAEAPAQGCRAVGVPWFLGRPRPPHTHRLQVWPPYPAKVLTEAAVRQAAETGVTLFRRWFADTPPGLPVTEVAVAGPGPGPEWTAGDVVTAVADFTERPA